MIRLLLSILLVSFTLTIPTLAAQSWITKASYYGGPHDHVRKHMAWGRRFDASNPYYVAHPWLPEGTRLLVENLGNHRKMCNEVGDRGPSDWMVKKLGRGIDMTLAAAEELDYVDQGVATVRVTLLGNSPCPV